MARSSDRSWQTRFALRLARSGTQLLSLALAALTMAALTLVAGLYAASRLSPEQKQVFKLGRYEHTTHSTITLPRGSDIPEQLAADLKSAGATDWAFEVHYEIAAQALGAGSYVVLEGDWGGQAAPPAEKYTLLSGRWPQANELVIGERLRARYQSESVSLGRDVPELPIVGVVRVEDQLDAEAILAGPGTWRDSFKNASKRDPDYAAGIQTYWSGGELEAVMQALVTNCERSLPEGMEDCTLADFGSNHDEAERILAQSRKTLEGYAAFGLLPLLGTALLAGVAIYAVGYRGLRDLLARSTAIGLPKKDVLSAHFTAGLASLITGALVGALVGLALLWPGRALLPRFTARAPSPFVPDWPVWLLATGTMIAAYCAVFFLLRPRKVARADVGRALLTPRAKRLVRRCCSLAAAGAFFGILPQVSYSDEANALAMALLAALSALLAPEAVKALASRKSTKPPHTLARRLQQEGTRATAALTSATAFIVSAMISILTLMNTMSATSNELSTASVPRGLAFLRVQPDSPEGMVDEFERHIGLSSGFPVHTAAVDDLSLPGTMGVVQSIGELQRLTNFEPSPEQRAALLQGAALVGAGNQITYISESQPHTLPAVSAPLDKHLIFGALLLTDTAHSLNIDTDESYDLYYTGVTDEQAEAIRRVQAELGFPPGIATSYREPDRIYPSFARRVLLVGFGTLCFAAVLLISLNQARALRPMLATVRAVGLPRKWLVSVLREQAVIGAGGAVLTALFGQAVFLLSLRFLTMHTSPAPWEALGLISAISVAAIWVVPLIAVARLTAAERQL